MGDDLPLLTMVKSREINESPGNLSDDCFKLLNT